MVDVVLKSNASMSVEQYTQWLEHLNKQSDDTNFVIIPDIFDIITVNPKYDDKGVESVQNRTRRLP